MKMMKALQVLVTVLGMPPTMTMIMIMMMIMMMMKGVEVFVTVLGMPGLATPLAVDAKEFSLSSCPTQKCPHSALPTCPP